MLRGLCFIYLVHHVPCCRRCQERHQAHLPGKCGHLLTLWQGSQLVGVVEVFALVCRGKHLECQSLTTG